MAILTEIAKRGNLNIVARKSLRSPKRSEYDEREGAHVALANVTSWPVKRLVA